LQYKELKIQIPKSRSEEWEAFLNELQIPGYYELLFDGERKKDLDSPILGDMTTFQVYLHPDEGEKERKIWIACQIFNQGLSGLETRLVETRDFEETYKEFYKPFQAGAKLWVVPVWEKPSFPKANPNDLHLYINPGMAFGTGHHETTKLILERLDSLKLIFPKVCDLGTGSGILSLALASLGSKDLLAVDIDPNAVKAAWENWKENDFGKEKKFRVVESGLDLDLLAQESFDLCVANITFAVLSQNQAHLAKISAPRFLFSGIITEKKEAFLEILHKSIPGELLLEKEWNEWWVLDLKRN